MTDDRLASAGRRDRDPQTARRLRILIVDDDHDTVATLACVLQDEGYEVNGVHSAAAAVAALRDFDPDVLVADIAMPKMTGWDLAREVRQVRGVVRPLLVAISGIYTKTADRALAQSVGFNYFLAKPCDPNVLIGLIAQHATRGGV